METHLLKQRKGGSKSDNNYLITVTGEYDTPFVLKKKRKKEFAVSSIDLEELTDL